MSYSRFLFIGLGGSGGATLGHLRNNIQQWLEEQGQPTEMPMGWQFLHIDTPQVSDGRQELKLPVDEYVGLINDGVTFGNIQSALDANDTCHKELETWRVDPATYPFGLNAGAGQFRAIGSTVALKYTQKIKDALDKAVQRLNLPQTSAELSDLYTSVTGNASSGSNTPLRIIIVSSLAGGSGAGLLMTVSDIIRSRGFEGSNDIFGILYTPDVFGSGPSFTGTTPNSLAAISEILNGYWWGGSGIDEGAGALTNPPAKQPATLASAGLPHPLENSGPRFPFLVGLTSSSGVNHGTPDNLFSVVGRSLLTWTTDITVQQKFIAYNITNWKAASMSHFQHDNTLLTKGLTSEKGYPAINSLGFARLSLGTDYFEEYAARRVTREALEFLVKNHVDSSEALQVAAELNVVDGDKIATAIAKKHLKGWLSRCGLDELGPDDNQIQNSLIPDNLAEINLRFKSQTATLSGIGDPGNNLKSDDWIQRLRSALQTSEVAYGESYRKHLDQKVEEWIENIQESICKETSSAIATWGLKVASALLAQAESEMSKVTHELTTVDATNFASWSEHWEGSFRGDLDGLNGKVSGSNADLEDALNRALHYKQYLGSKMGAERASELAHELINRVLSPTRQAVDEAFYASDSDLGEVSSWPSWNDVAPQRELLPPTSEFTLVDPEDWHSLFKEMLGGSYSTKTSGSQREELRETVTRGTFEPAPTGDSQSIEIKHDWRPSLPVFITADSRTATNLQLSVNTSKVDLKNRAKLWMKRSGTPFGDFLGISLRSYLGDDGQFGDGDSAAILTERQNKFRSQLAAALEAAEPLVHIDQALMGQVHPNGVLPTSRFISMIPLGSHELSLSVSQTLSAYGIDDNTISDTLNSDNKLKRIDITTTLGAPHNLLVVSSLMKPVAERWAQAVSTGTESAFWAMRRSKPLREFIPAPQALIHCLVRGWYTALLLGKVDTSKSPKEIYRDSANPAKFPNSELSSWFTDGLDDMARILESLSIAMAKTSETSTLEPLQAYIELRDLGQSNPASGLYLYEDLHPELKLWVETGNTKGLVSPQLGDTATGSDSHAQISRCDTLIGLLENAQNLFEREYEKYVVDRRNNPSALTFTKLWTGLFDIIKRELSNLTAAAQRHRRDLESGGNSSPFGTNQP